MYHDGIVHVNILNLCVCLCFLHYHCRPSPDRMTDSSVSQSRCWGLHTHILAYTILPSLCSITCSSIYFIWHCQPDKMRIWMHNPWFLEAHQQLKIYLMRKRWRIKNPTFTDRGVSWQQLSLSIFLRKITTARAKKQAHLKYFFKIGSE